MPLKLGFTGTRHGMNASQLVAAETLICEFAPCEAHHGDCVGADADFAELVRKTFPACKLVAHPCNLDKLRANTQAHEVRSVFPPLVRNRHIVDEADRIIATPAEMEEQQRGGTWSTIRYARKNGKLLVIVFPDATVERFDGRN